MEAGAPRRNRRTPLYVAAALAVALCLGLPLFGVAGYNLFYFAQHQFEISPTPLATPTATATLASPTVAPVCGGPPAMFILLIGSDSRANNYAAGLADSMRIVRVDFVQPGLTYLTFQRDLYVEIPGIASHGGITHGKLNQAYLYGNPAFGYFDGPGQGPGLLALTLKTNFGAQTDHYVAVNLQSFTRIIDQLGGLDIDLPYVVDGRAARSKDPSRYFAAGPLHLNGYRTMLLARLRPNGDLERSRTQSLILQALAKQLLRPATIPKLPGLVESLYGSVQTDMGTDDIRKLLCLGSMLKEEDIAPRDFPESLFTGSRIHDPVLGYTFVWDVDFDVLREYVRQFDDGSWPAEPPSSTPESGGTP